MLTAFIDGKLTGEEMLLRLINRRFQTAMTIQEIVFDEPVALPPTAERNTSVTARPRGWGYIGQKTFNYDRLPLTVFFQNIDVTVAGDLSVIGNTYDLIPRINNKYRTSFRERDFVLKAVNNREVVLEAAPSSYVWSGSIPLFITGDDDDLNNIFYRRFLNGLYL